jgi:hypothetical protein
VWRTSTGCLVGNALSCRRPNASEIAAVVVRWGGDPILRRTAPREVLLKTLCCKAEYFSDKPRKSVGVVGTRISALNERYVTTNENTYGSPSFTKDNIYELWERIANTFIEYVRVRAARVHPATIRIREQSEILHLTYTFSARHVTFSAVTAATPPTIKPKRLTTLSSLELDLVPENFFPDGQQPGDPPEVTTQL